MARPPITTVEVVTGWLRSNKLPGSVGDDQIQLAYQSAEDYVGRRVRWVITAPAEGEPYPPAPGDLVLAVCLQTARYLARRNSPDGFVGSDEMGPVRIGGRDYDVAGLMAPYRPVVV